MKASSSSRYQSRSQQGGHPSREVTGASSAGYVSPAALPSGQTAVEGQHEEAGARSGGVGGGIG
jgi:hypothetical protein